MLPLAIDKDFLEEHDRWEAESSKAVGPDESQSRDVDQEELKASEKMNHSKLGGIGDSRDQTLGEAEGPATSDKPEKKGTLQSIKSFFMRKSDPKQSVIKNNKASTADALKASQVGRGATEAGRFPTESAPGGAPGVPAPNQKVDVGDLSWDEP